MVFADTLRLVFAPPHRAGYPFLIGGLVAFALGLLFAAWLVWLALAFLLFALYFFRDPERFPPSRTGLVLAPADGKVVSSAPAIPPAELGLSTAPRWRVGIFLSALDVHVNRMPVDGTVTRIAYRHGKFLNASLDKASALNERNALVVRLADGRELGVVQIAGLIARRIVFNRQTGDHVAKGERVGLIKFGSRVDVFLGPEWEIAVKPGDRVQGGSSVLARRKQV